MKRREIIEALKECKHKDWNLVIVSPIWKDPQDDHVVSFCWSYIVSCSKTGKSFPLRGPTHRIFAGASEREMVQVVRASLHEIYLHEADEFFRYRGVMVFDPHIGDAGYEPERTITVRKPFSIKNARSAAFTPEDCRLPIRMDGDMETITIDPDEYRRFR